MITLWQNQVQAREEEGEEKGWLGATLGRENSMDGGQGEGRGKPSHLPFPSSAISVNASGPGAPSNSNVGAKYPKTHLLVWLNHFPISLLAERDRQIKYLFPVTATSPDHWGLWR